MVADWESVLSESEDATRSQYEQLFGGQQQDYIPPNVAAIAKVLIDQPLLVQPTLEFIQQKQAAMAEAQLIALYGEERVREMQAQIE